VAAFHPELAPLRATLGAALHGRIGPHQVTASAVGIGLAQASVGAAVRVGDARPRAVVLVGTCGAYPGSDLAVGDVIAGRRVLLVDPSVVDGGAQFPEPMSLACEADVAMREGLSRAGARPADIATTLAVTVDDALAGRIAAGTGAHVEHLEAHGVATACAAWGVPFAAALGVANGVGSRAREEWRVHHRSAAEAAVRVVVAWLASLTSVRA
jgi:nucleoside phosphorylase